MLNSPVSLRKFPLYRVNTPISLFLRHPISKKMAFSRESLQHFSGHLVRKKCSIRFREFDIRTPHFGHSYHYIFKAKTSPVRAKNTTAKAKFFPAEFNANKHKNFIWISSLFQIELLFRHDYFPARPTTILFWFSTMQVYD